MRINFKDLKQIIKNIKKTIQEEYWFVFTFKLASSKILKYIYDICDFWPKIALYEFLQIFDCVLPRDIWNRINTTKLECCMEFLERKYSKFIDDYKTKEISPWRNDKKIRVLWRQWINRAPELVKRCVKSIKDHNCDYEVILLDKDNYKQYIELPDFITKKAYKGKITLTHLSDIIRMGLLKQYWGIWVDATVFVNSDVFKSFNDINLNSAFYTMKWVMPRWWNTKRDVWLIWWKTNRLFNFCYDFFIQYWKDYNHLIDYFLIDYTILIAYRHFKDCKEDIDNIGNENPQAFSLPASFNERYDEKKYNELMKIPFSKLSLKCNNKEIDSQWNRTIYWKFMQDTK